MTPGIVSEEATSISRALLPLRVACHWPENHQSQVMITLFQIITYSPFVTHCTQLKCTTECHDGVVSTPLCFGKHGFKYLLEGCLFWQVFFPVVLLSPTKRMPQTVSLRTGCTCRLHDLSYYLMIQNISLQHFPDLSITRFSAQFVPLHNSYAVVHR